MNSNVAAAENKITIDYALTRGEVERSYLRAIRESPEYLRRVLTMAAVIGLGQMGLRALSSRLCRWP